MLNLNIERVELGTDEMQKLVRQGHRVRETPHLGGPYFGKYALTLGGLASDVVLVDTIKAARDKFGKVQDLAGIRILSNSEGERIPAAATNNFALEATKKKTAQARLDEVASLVESLGVAGAERFFQNGAVDFVALHTHCTESVVADGISVSTFADLWRKSGETANAMMFYMAEQGLLERWYDSEAKEVMGVNDTGQSALLRSEGSYFDSCTTVHGVLPPVEAMLAIEAVQAVIDGRDVTYDHLYVRSTEYTKDEAVNDRVRDIALGTLALLGGLSGQVSYRYIIADNQLLDEIGGAKTHFDMLKVGQRFDADTLTRKWSGSND